MPEGTDTVISHMFNGLISTQHENNAYVGMKFIKSENILYRYKGKVVTNSYHCQTL